ncbi:MAG: MerC domain-containing protein [Erysipelotrichaceae bacterium]|nr:MerC domain-containing protein [Erysipelotrichaceae bacterium]
MFKKFSIVTLLLWIFGWGIAYLVLLPPINPMSLKFWFFFGPAVLIPLVILIQTLSFKGGFRKGKALWPVLVVLIGVAVYFGGTILTSPMFNSAGYANRIAVTEASFEEDIKPVDFDNLPLLDKASAQKVGDRVVGQIAELVSQFDVSDEYSLINYNGKIVRVTPLEHIDLYKYLGNRNGTAGYVIVDCTTGEAQLIRTDEGLKYLPSSYLFKNLNRHVHMHYPFAILGETSFEIDENGVPYWIIQTMKYAWVNVRPAVSGVITCNAITGELNKYTVGEVPAWIDNVFDAHLVIDEINSWGTYQGGYVNSQFSQKNVVQATDGYTYITADDDVFMYTGITSVASDESNIGFVMVNLRTHEARYYAVPGAEEYSAMDSAKGAVQEKNYTSTFPLLINLEGRPTYLLSLKDSAELVKMYAFVDVQDYQKVYVSDVGKGIKYAAAEYLKMLKGDTTPYNPTPSVDPTPTVDPTPSDKTLQEETVTIQNITSVIVDNNTVFYVLSTYNKKYEIVANVDLTTDPFLQAGDTSQVICYEGEIGLNIVTQVKLLSVGEPMDLIDPETGTYPEAENIEP